MTPVEAVFRAEYGRAVATLVRLLGDLSLAEEAVAEAFTVAVEHSASDGNELVRAELCAEAIRLARLLAELMPDEPEVLGLLALLLLTEARRPARVDADGALVLLPDQDRGLWDAVLVEEGQQLVRACLRRNAPGPYQLQAAIAAVHSDGPTDWRQVLALYDQLLAVVPTPVVALNRAVALAEVEGPGAALLAVDALDLPTYLPFHLARAELLVRTGRTGEALAAYDQALALATNAVEREHLERQRDRTGRSA